MNKITYAIFLVLTVIFISMSVVKAWYWSPVSYDAIAGYDLYGKLIAEGENPYETPFDGVGNRGKIPPLIPVLLAIFKITGLNSQLLMSVILIATCLLLYLNIKNKTHAIIAVFLTVITPEFLAFSSIVNTNTAVALFVLGGVIYMFKEEMKNIHISIIFFSLAVLCRSDAVVFVVIAFLFKDSRILLALIPFAIWQVYIGGAGVFGFPTFEKLGILAHGMLNYAINMEGFGVLFIAFFGVLLFRRHNREQIDLMWLIIALFIGNAFLYLCLDPVIMGASYEHIINASFKRSLFVFVPLIWYYVWNKNED